jgi:Kef-type K+ transport system membrane component KefB
MELNILLVLAIVYLIAYINKRLTPKLEIPEVTGYVILGVLASFLSSVFLKRTAFDDILNNLEVISSIALSIIGFSIGIELKWSVIKKLGKSIFFIVFLETAFTFSLVFLALYFFGFEIYTSLLLGAVASATAPAATVSVIRQYKAKGELTSAILAVVGIDDAFALTIYVIASSFAKSLIDGKSITIVDSVSKVGFSVAGSFGIGICFSLVYLFILKRVKDNDTVEILLVSFLFFMLGISEIFHISELLTIMTFGAVIANNSEVITKKSENIINKFTSILVGAFFIIGGAHLDTKVISSVFIVGVVYFFVRSVGKITGASLGAYLGKAPIKIKKYIGFALLPQVGVGLALALAIKKDFSGVSTMGQDLGYFVFNLLLFTTLITEFVGPTLTKKVLLKAGEIDK